jgi:hypothetical protein
MPERKYLSLLSLTEEITLLPQGDFKYYLLDVLDVLIVGGAEDPVLADEGCSIQL